MSDSANVTIWMWLMSGASAIITTLIGVIFWATHAKIDRNAKNLDDYKEEVRGDFMKNDRDHTEMWALHKETREERENKCVTRIEYDKDIRNMMSMIAEVKTIAKELNDGFHHLSEAVIKIAAKGE